MNLHQIKDGKFVCLGDQDAPCRNYPGCSCDYFGEDHDKQPGHEKIPQPQCWIDTWFEATSVHELYFGDEGEAMDWWIFPDGPVDWEFDDGITWSYEDDTKPVDPEDFDERQPESRVALDPNQIELSIGGQEG